MITHTPCRDVWATLHMSLPYISTCVPSNSSFISNTSSDMLFCPPTYKHISCALRAKLFSCRLWSGTRRVCKKSTRVLGRVMRQNFRSGNNTSPIKKCAHLKHSIFSQHGNHGRRPPRPLPTPIVLRRPFRHDRPLPNSNYNVGYALFLWYHRGGPERLNFCPTIFLKGE
jgi:hypothetical protein